MSSSHLSSLETSLKEQKYVALNYLTEAFEEARLEGVEGECLSQVALFVAFKELVELYGEDVASDFADKLTQRIQDGEFTVKSRQ